LNLLDYLGLHRNILKQNVYVTKIDCHSSSPFIFVVNKAQGKDPGRI